MIMTNCRKIKIAPVQINNSFSNQNYLPYSAGLLQAYAQKYLAEKNDFEFLLPIYKRIPVNEAEKKLSGADIVFFSTYTWNIKISLEIAGRLKKLNPGILTIFGGPQVPNENSEAFMRKFPFVDIACRGEGEKTFLSILENYSTGNWKEVPSISYIDRDGIFSKTPDAGRISKLDEIPSPYTDGIFEPLIDANPQENWVGLWETNRGCPFSCTYCVWGAASQNKVYKRNIENLYAEIDWFRRHEIEFIFCCDANFGILSRDIDIVKYFAESKQKYGYPKALSVQNTKNSTMRLYNIYKLMSDAGLSKGVALALQSVNNDTLKNIKRQNISVDTFHKLQNKFNEENIETFTDIILGLPGETYETFVNGVSSVIENGQHNRIQFNNLSLLVNSEMAEQKYRKEHGILTVETKLINIHGSLSDVDEIQETQQLVVGTDSMPKSDWVKARVFGWITSLLHFDKLLQIPFIVLHNVYSVSFRELIDIFIVDKKSFPILSEICSFFTDKAKAIQNGDSEFCESKKWLNIWWPADELIFIRLCTENKLSEFYGESEILINNYMRQKNIQDYRDIISDAVLLNKHLIKMPLHNENLSIKLSHNIRDVYKTALKGASAQLKKGSYTYGIDRTTSKWSSWENWCREVVWYGNKKGAYLYNCREIKERNHEITQDLHR